MRVLLLIVCMLYAVGCSSIAKTFSVESPRPDKTQITAAQQITEKNVPVIVGAQTDKQSKISQVTRAAIHALKTAQNPAQVEGITNVTANGINAIQIADGTAKILGRVQEKTVSDILHMPMAEYLGYVAGQTPIAMNNREQVYEGIKAGWQWTNKTIAEVAGSGVAGGGMIGLLVWSLRKLAARGKLLEATGEAVKEYSKENPDSGERLVSYLARKHSTVPLNAKKEFRV